MKKNKLIFLLALICYSCASNESDEVNFPVTLYFQEVLTPSPVRLFVEGKEVFDKDKIQSFIGSDSENFNPVDAASHSTDSNSTIYFSSKDSVTFGSSEEKFFIQKSGAQFLFYSRRTIPTSYTTGALDFLKYHSEELPVPPVTDSQYAIRDTRVGYGSYNTLELSGLAYKLIRSHSGYTGRSFNEFNEGVVDAMVAGDTLAILEYKVRFKAK